MGKLFKQDGAHSTLEVTNLVRNALKELIRALDLHQLPPIQSKSGSRRFRIPKPFLPPGRNSSKVAHARRSPDQYSRRVCSNSTTPISECRDDSNHPASASSPAIVDSSNTNSGSSVSARRDMLDMDKLQSRLALLNAKQHSPVCGQLETG